MVGLEEKRLPTAAVIASFTSSLFIEQTRHSCSVGKLRRSMRAAHGPHTCSRPYGIGIGPGNGGTPQMSDAHGYCVKSKVGIRDEFPWVDAVSRVVVLNEH